LLKRSRHKSDDSEYVDYKYKGYQTAHVRITEDSGRQIFPGMPHDRRRGSHTAQAISFKKGRQESSTEEIRNSEKEQYGRKAEQPEPYHRYAKKGCCSLEL